MNNILPMKFTSELDINIYSFMKAQRFSYFDKRFCGNNEFIPY